MTSIHAMLAATTLATATFAASAAPPTEQVHHRSVNIQDVDVVELHPKLTHLG